MNLMENQRKPEIAMFAETGKLAARRAMRDADPSMAISVAVVGLATASGMMQTMAARADDDPSAAAALVGDLLGDLDAMFKRLNAQMCRDASEIFARHRARLAKAGGVDGLRERGAL